MTFEATLEKKTTADQSGAQEGFATGVDFVDAVLYSAIQRPADGGVQFGAKISTSLGGGDFQAPQMIAPLKQHEAWSGSWMSQHAGNIVGSLPWIIGAHKVVRGLTGGVLAPTAKTLPLARAGMMGAEAGLTGAAFEGFLRPVDTGNFWHERAKNASAGFAAFSIMGGTASLFSRPLSTGGMNSLRERLFVRGGNAAVGFGAGSGGGIAHALTEDVYERRAPSFDRLSKTALEYGAFGMAFGAIGRPAGTERTMISAKERIMEKDSVPSLRPGELTAQRARELSDTALENYNRGPNHYAEAQRNYAESLRINEHVYGKESLQVALNLEQLASIHKAMGDYAGAAARLEQAIATYDAVGKTGLLPVSETPHTMQRRLEDLSDLYRVADKPDQVLRVQRLMSERQ